jgi:hypothetical protein
VELIFLRYPERNFDTEPLFYAHDSLYLFTKEPYKTMGRAQVFRLAPGDTSGELNPVSHFFLEGPITGADIHEGAAAFLTYGYITIIRGFGDGDWGKADMTTYTIPFSQTEAIGWLDGNTLYFTNEAGKLFRVSIPASE